MECTCGQSFTNLGGFSAHKKYCKLTKDIISQIIIDYIEEEYSCSELRKKYKIGNTLIVKLLGNNIRSRKDAKILASKKFPFSHTEISKEILRHKRLAFMKENPDNTSWRTSNMSYPEKLFNSLLQEEGIDKEYAIIREYSVFPYYIDFAFVNEKFAIEIDGSQHLLEERIKKDNLKDNLLNEKGWTVYRVTASQLISNKKEVLLDILEKLKDKESNKLYRCGLSTNKEIKQKIVDEKRAVRELWINERKNIINLSGIDFKKFGAFTKASRLLNISSQKAGEWIKKYMPELLQEVPIS